MTEDGGVLLGRIVIERILTEDGEDIVQHTAQQNDGTPLAVIDTLGMLALTEDSVLHGEDE